MSLLALFLIVAGARLWLVERYTTALPCVDQWDGEGAAVLKPWVEGRLRWRDLLAPHNEHRIVLTRLWSLGLFAANRQWDGQWEASANALLCGGFAVLIAAALVQVFGVGWRWTILGGMAVASVLPFGWENTLNGFQSQNYFLIIFSLAAIWGLGLRRAGAAGWWAGLAGATLACLSMGSGFLAAAAVLGLIGARATRERARPEGRDILTAAVCSGLVGLGWSTRTVVPVNADLRAESVAGFWRAFRRFLAWPFYDQPGMLWLTAAPLAILAAVYLRRGLRRREWRHDPRMELLLAIGGWCVLQVAALAFTRDGHGAPPACRYMDLLALFPLANFLAAALLATHTFGAGRKRFVSIIAVVGWTSLLGVGLERETAKDFRIWLPGYLAAQWQGEVNTRGYLRTGDFARYLAGKSANEIPFPDVRRLQGLLDDPTIRDFLPADVRTPLRVRMDAMLGKGVLEAGGVSPALAATATTPCWGSYPGRTGTSQGSVSGTGLGAAGLPYLQFEFAGDLGEPGLSFALSAADGSRRLEWQPTRVPRERWHTDYLRRPGADLRLEASVGRQDRWFAFTEPVEVGGWSYRAGWVRRRAAGVFWVGWGLMALAVGVWRCPQAARRRRWKPSLRRTQCGSHGVDGQSPSCVPAQPG